MCGPRDRLLLEDDFGAPLRVYIKIHEPICDKASLRNALEVFTDGLADCKDLVGKYGEVRDWDVSAITDMSSLCVGLDKFNEPIGEWGT